jgi:hypothetical protein
MTLIFVTLVVFAVNENATVKLTTSRTASRELCCLKTDRKLVDSECRALLMFQVWKARIGS